MAAKQPPPTNIASNSRLSRAPLSREGFADYLREVLVQHLLPRADSLKSSLSNSDSFVQELEEIAKLTDNLVYHLKNIAPKDFQLDINRPDNLKKKKKRIIGKRRQPKRTKAQRKKKRRTLQTTGTLSVKPPPRKSYRGVTSIRIIGTGQTRKVGSRRSQS